MPRNVRITRRQLTGALIGARAALAQTPAQPVKPQTPAEELEAARRQRQRNAERLTKFELPMATEPAFQFRA